MSSRPVARSPRSAFGCTACGHVTARWAGRCPQCQAWGTLTEQAAPVPALRRVSAGPPAVPAQRIVDVDTTPVQARPSGLGEFDRVLGGGLVPAGVVLLAGEPGVGKSTLLLTAAGAWARAGHGRALIVTGEETAGQVRRRADRLGVAHPEMYLAAETDLAGVLGHIEATRPTLVIVDSVQTIADPGTEGAAGGVAQVKAVAAALTAAARANGFACVLVGHVTKDGAVAGPRVLEHMVDVVLHFEGDRGSPLRLVRGVKNRFGPADEIGCFAMSDSGIESLADPSGLFLSGRRAATPGGCATVVLSGRRALPVEVQALVGRPVGDAVARRTVSGLDPSRVALVLAVVQRWGEIGLAGKDVLVATVGGVRTTEPAADLALALAAWSSARDRPLEPDLIAIGEVGLSAELRPVAGLERRQAEAARLGFRHAIVPRQPGRSIGDDGPLRITAADDLGAALRAVGGDRDTGRWLRAIGN